MTLAYVFNTEADANTAMTVIEAVMRSIALKMGYELDEHGHVIGKEAKTGEPALDKQHVDVWSPIIALTDGRYAILSYRDYLKRVIDGVPLYAMVDAQIPVVWTHEDVTAVMPEMPE